MLEPYYINKIDDYNHPYKLEHDYINKIAFLQ